MYDATEANCQIRGTVVSLCHTYLGEGGDRWLNILCHDLIGLVLLRLITVLRWQEILWGYVIEMRSMPVISAVGGRRG